VEVWVHRHHWEAEEDHRRPYSEEAGVRHHHDHFRVEEAEEVHRRRLV